MKKIKWGVIGCGGIADRRTIPGLLKAKNCELVAVMDTDAAAADNCKKKYGAKYAFTDYRELLALKEIDAVYIATPVSFHLEQATAAARAGKHILLEKPLGLSVEQGEKIKKICEEHGVKLGTGFMMRQHGLHRRMRELIADGRLGTLVSARAQFTCWYPEIDGAWRQNKYTSGGGALMDMGIHCIDLMCYISGLEADKVVALMGNQIFNYGVEDAGSVIMKMNNGALFYVDAAFNIPDDAAVCKLEFYGTGGSIFAEGTIGQNEAGYAKITYTDSGKGYDAKQQRSGSEAEVLNADTQGNLYTKELEAFADAILSGSENPACAEQAIAAQRIVEAAYKSSGGGRAIEILKDEYYSYNSGFLFE